MKNFRYFFIYFILSCFVEKSSAQRLILPSPTGKYSVGTKAIEIQDSTRTMLRGKNHKRWMIQAFYPTKKHQNLYPYMPDTLNEGIVQGTKVFAFAKPNAKPLKEQKCPVILAIPGRGGERQTSTILYEDLASHGYVVLAFDQPYVANFVKFPDGTKIVLTFQDVWKLPRDRDYRYAYDDEVITHTIKDIQYLLNNFAKFNIQTLAGICDDSRIVLMGHSLGGNVAHIFGFQDSRIKAVIDVDSKITERKVFRRIGVPPNPSGKPVLFIRGMMQYQEDVGDQLTKITNATIWSPFVEHSAFGDEAYFAAHIPNYGMGFWQSLYNWFFKKGPYFSNIGTNLGSKSANAWFVEYRKYVVNWLDNTISAQ